MNFRPCVAGRSLEYKLNRIGARTAVTVLYKFICLLIRGRSGSPRLVPLVSGWKRQLKSTCRCPRSETSFRHWLTGNPSTFRTGIPSWRDCCRTHSAATPKQSWYVRCCCPWIRLVICHSGRTLANFLPCPPLDLRLMYVTTYVGKPSAIGQPTRPTQPVILLGSISK